MEFHLAELFVDKKGVDFGLFYQKVNQQDFGIAIDQQISRGGAVVYTHFVPPTLLIQKYPIVMVQSYAFNVRSIDLCDRSIQFLFIA